MSLDHYKETACSCGECVAACRHRPGWPTPGEVRKLIEAGHAGRMMLDYWVADTEDIQIIAPAVAGSEGKDAPFIPLGMCCFLTGDHRCEIHALKPAECRLSGCHGNNEGLHEAAAMTWNNDEGRAVVALWKETAKYE